MIDKNTNEAMLASLDRVMRLLRRRPAGRQHLGRGTYRLLLMIQKNNLISTRELAHLLGIRPSSLNERLTSLEEKEIIARRRDPKDLRVFLVELLPAGEIYLEKVRTERNQFNEAVGTILTKAEAEQLMQLAEKLADGIEAFPEENETLVGNGNRTETNGSQPLWK